MAGRIRQELKEIFVDGRLLEPEWIRPELLRHDGRKLQLRSLELKEVLCLDAERLGLDEARDGGLESIREEHSVMTLSVFQVDRASFRWGTSSREERRPCNPTDHFVDLAFFC